MPNYHCFLTEIENGCMNLVISGITSGINESLSDDDVIEVVRDEAPIEILSDGEETELQNSKLNQLATVMEDFHFTSVPSISDSHNEQNVESRDANDPLMSVSPKESTEENSQDANPNVTKADIVVDNIPPVANENKAVEENTAAKETDDNKSSSASEDKTSSEPSNIQNAIQEKNNSNDNSNVPVSEQI